MRAAHRSSIERNARATRKLRPGRLFTSKGVARTELQSVKLACKCRCHNGVCRPSAFEAIAQPGVLPFKPVEHSFPLRHHSGQGYCRSQAAFHRRQ